MQSAPESSSRQTVDRLTKYKTARDLYFKGILASESFPRTPSDLPSVAIVPAVILGGLEEGILKTRESGRETKQWIRWNSKQGCRKTPLFLGTEKDTTSFGSVLNNFLTYLAEVAIVEHHTHPGINWEPSAHDVARGRGLPRSSHIDLIGSDIAVVGLFKTKMTERIPFSSILTILGIRRYLRNGGFDELTSPVDIALEIEKQGFGFYLWSPLREIVKGDLANGIVMRRILG